MKKLLVLSVLFTISAFMAAAAFADATTKLDLKVGEEVYACNCGVECDCNTMSRKEGACVCKKPMVNAKVVSVGQGTAMLQAKDWEKPRPFKTVGKFACACGPECNCGTISQKPGNCVCGKPMKEVR